MNDEDLLAESGAALAQHDFFVVFGYRNDEIGGFHFFLQHMLVRLNIRTSSREAKGDPGQAMNNQTRYGCVVRKVRADVLDRLVLHFISESNRLREQVESPAKTAKASPGSSQYF